MITRAKRKKTNYTHIWNSAINDEALDWKDLGLLVFLLSKPDDWVVSTKHLAAQRKTGIDGIKSSLKSLRAAGYVELQKLGSGHTNWIVHDTARSENPKVENPPLALEPEVENPSEGKSTPLVNTDLPLVITEIVVFENFWIKYDNKKDKLTAERAWKKLNLAQQTKAIEVIDQFKKSVKQGLSLPYPATYLNGHRFDDDLTPAPILDAKGNPTVRAAQPKPFVTLEHEKKGFKKATPKRSLKDELKDIKARGAAA